MHILTVCTANICRSPATAALLRRGLAQLPVQGAVSSAGVAAQPGHAACDVTAALVGEYVVERSQAPSPDAGDLVHHRSRTLDREDVQQAALILALDRSHRSAIARLDPTSRSRTFTLRQAAAAAELVGSSLRAGGLPEGAPPIPSEAQERFTWWVEELDAARGLVPWDRTESAGGLTIDLLDVPDPHVFGYQYHPMAVERIEAAVGQLLNSLSLVLRFG